MKPLSYRCPNPKCRVMLSIPASMTGQSVRCGNCSQEFVVPFVVSGKIGRPKPQPQPRPPLRKAS